MNKQTEALKMAIEAMELHVKLFDCEQYTSICELEPAKDAIQACKDALAQPAQEYLTRAQQVIRANNSAQEPVAFTNSDELSELQSGMTTCYIYKQAIDDDDIALYTHPTPSWQGLSDDEVQEVFNLGHKTFKEFARAIEQALKEKNNAKR